MTNFEAAGTDRAFYPAIAARTPEQKVVVKCEQVSSVVAVRYAFGDWVKSTLCDQAGVPASSFITDNWQSFMRNMVFC
ncbi:MAG TPA: hypothetical protein PKC69_04945 [Chitinophagaceae bacterium]|nr:hypothetical protein [Chitinophagaceae bacterium]